MSTSGQQREGMLCVYRGLIEGIATMGDCAWSESLRPLLSSVEECLAAGASPSTDRLREIMREAADDHVSPRPPRRPGTGDECMGATREAFKAGWKSLPREQRERLVLDGLGDESLTVRELAERLDTKLRTPACGVYAVIDDSCVRNYVERMRAAKQLRREPEVYRKNCTRWRYSRRRGLDGPIADLERAFHNDEE